MPQIGPAEILVILLVGLLVFGPKRLPEIGRQVGRAMREVRKFQDTVKDELNEVLHFNEDDDRSRTVSTSTSPAELPPADSSAPTEAPPATPARPASRAPSRFRAPGPRPTT